MNGERHATDTRIRSRYDIARDCVHCGLCLPACPTYLQLGNEADSPRGRIYLMRAHEEGRAPVTPALEEHLDLCLACRACESACPSGVRFGSMLEDFRAMLRQSEQGPQRRFRPWGTVGSWLLLRVVPVPRRLRAVVQLLRIAQASGLVSLARRAGALGMRRMAALAAQAPPVPAASLRQPWPTLLPARGPRRARVSFLRGCVAPELLPEVQYASIEALRYNGCDVITPPEQTCCGALHQHMGFHRQGLELVERNLQAFDLEGCDAVVVNAAGCGSTLKEYGALGREISGWEEAAQRFASRVRDIHEFLDELGLVQPAHPFEARVAYDDPCHLLHGQRIGSAPRNILQAIRGLRLVPLVEADHCCGSAGVYNVLHPEMARRILEEKVGHIARSGADLVATGNPGCILQIRSGLRRAAAGEPRLAGIRVVHPMQLLAAAYTGEAIAGSSFEQA